ASALEYGYSVDIPHALVMWEAQFGDFANGAQSIVDEFVSSGEVKWGQRASVVLLLPHSHEGQGPDHTSGRLERYLQLCAEDNIRVAVPTTPANHFHLLRRQALSNKKNPLVVFPPKSLLRPRQCVSSVADFTDQQFQPVMADPGRGGNPLDDAKVKGGLLCTGKIFYDLLQGRNDRTADDVAILRVEQLYPLPVDELRAALGRYPNAEDYAWVQEEPANQGAWSVVGLNLLEHLEGVRLRRISRPAAAAPAAGSAEVADAAHAAANEEGGTPT